MTREEAIRVLRNIAFQFGSVMRVDNITAIDMAIEALSNNITESTNDVIESDDDVINDRPTE